MAGKFKLRRAVLIGLGGTGVKTLTYIKREFLRNFGRVPSFIKLVGFDTDKAAKQALRLDGKTVVLTDPEFRYLPVIKVREIIERTPEVKDWIPPFERMNLADITEGAGARRPSGRLALFHHAPEVYRKIEQAYDLVRAFAAGETEEQFSVSEDEIVHVFIITSLAGGTGSGMFLDVAHFCRAIVGEQNRIHGYLVLAGPYLRYVGISYAEPNTYGALKELEYWMTGECPKREVHYPGGLTIPWGGEDYRPFNYVYLIDNENEVNLRINETDKVINFMARALFLQLTVESGEGVPGGVGPIWVNLSSYLSTAASQNRRYMGLGMANLEVPVERAIALASSETVLNCIESLISSDMDMVQTAGAMPEEVTEFVALSNLDVDRLKNEIISPDSRISIDPPPPKVWQKDAEVVRKWRDDNIRKVNQEYTKMASEDGDGYRRILGNAREAIRKKVETLLTREKAVGNTESFLRALEEYLKDAQKRLEEEIELNRRKRQELLYPERELDQAYTGGGWVPRRRRVMDMVAAFTKLMQEESALIREIWRGNAAINLLGSLRGQVREYLDRVGSLKKLLARAAHLARIEFESKRASRGLEDEFTTTLGEEFLERDISNVRQMIDTDYLVHRWQEQYREIVPSAAEEDGTLLGWNRLTAEQLVRWLNNIVQERFASIAETNVEEVLETMAQSDSGDGEARVVGAVQDFVNKSIPFWKITRESGQEIYELFIFGLPERSGGLEASFLKRLIDEGKISLGESASSGNCYYAITWEKYRLRALKIKMPIPLYILDRLAGYKQKYLSLEGDPEKKFTAHTHKDWVGPDALPDIVSE